MRTLRPVSEAEFDKINDAILREDLRLSDDVQMATQDARGMRDDLIGRLWLEVQGMRGK